MKRLQGHAHCVLVTAIINSVGVLANALLIAAILKRFLLRCFSSHNFSSQSTKYAHLRRDSSLLCHGGPLCLTVEPVITSSVSEFFEIKTSVIPFSILPIRTAALVIIHGPCSAVHKTLCDFAYCKVEVH